MLHLHLRVDDLVAADPAALHELRPDHRLVDLFTNRLVRGAVPVQPPASWGISIVRVPDHSPWRLHSAVADTSEVPPFIRAWNAR